MDRFAITAEGPSSELATGFLGAVCERPTGHTYPAPHEPARFVPFDPEITARALATANELIRCYEGRIRGLVQDNAVYKGFWKQEQGEHKRLGELAAGLTTQVDAARKALEGAKSDIEGCFIACRCGEQQDLKDLDLMHFIDKALALIDAGQNETTFPKVERQSYGGAYTAWVTLDTDRRFKFTGQDWFRKSDAELIEYAKQHAEQEGGK